MNNTAVLLSGGMDSAALSFWVKPRHTITINYGQKAACAEIRAAREISKEISAEHHVLEIDCSCLGSGDMSDSAAIAIAPSTDWWPFRNQLLITFAVMKAVYLGVDTLCLGSVKNDCDYRDGTAEFIDRISNLTSYQEGNISVTAPAVNLTTEQLVAVSQIPQEILAWSHSCHTSNFACGRCRGCNKHREVMEGVYDRVSY